jgi:hypothetical protein
MMRIMRWRITSRWLIGRSGYGWQGQGEGTRLVALQEGLRLPSSHYRVSITMYVFAISFLHSIVNV